MFSCYLNKDKIYYLSPIYAIQFYYERNYTTLFVVTQTV